MTTATLQQHGTSLVNSKRKFCAYPNSRPSKVWGITSLPEHWNEKPLKFVAQLNSEKLGDTTDPDYEIEYVDIGNVSLETGINSTERFRFENAPSRARRKVNHGDTIVSTVRTYLKAVAHIVNPADNLIVSTGFAVLRARTALDPGYLYRLAQSEPFVERIMAHSVGVSYPAINAPVIGRFTIPLPPLDEQRSIAAFVDREMAKIDELIGWKNELVKLLQQQRIAITSKAATRGVNDNPTLKPSGVDWLGDIPSHWIALPLKRIAEIEYGLGLELDRTLTSGTPILSLPNVTKDGRLILDDVCLVELSPDEKKRYLLKKGDLLFNWRNGSPDHVGKTAYFDSDGEYAHVSFLLRLRFDTAKHEPRFFRHVLNNLRNTGFFGASKNQVNKTYNQTELRQLRVMVPPLPEQKDIADYADELFSKSEALVHQTHNGIARLQNYRGALITAAVTGQIDVRNYREEASCP